jgi:hypothetical protein
MDRVIHPKLDSCDRPSESRRHWGGQSPSSIHEGSLECSRRNLQACGCIVACCEQDLNEIGNSGEPAQIRKTDRCRRKRGSIDGN